MLGVQRCRSALRRFCAAPRRASARTASRRAIAAAAAPQRAARAVRRCDALRVTLPPLAPPARPLLTLPRARAAQDEVCVPEAERRGVAPAKCGGCTCAALPAPCATLCAAPSAAARAALYDPLLPCPLRRVRGFACDLERAAADAAALPAPWVQSAKTPRRATSADASRHAAVALREVAPPPRDALAHAPPPAKPPALPHAGSEWRAVLGIKPPLPLPCAPIRGEPPVQRAAALAAATEAAAAFHQPQHTASG